MNRLSSHRYTFVRKNKLWLMVVATVFLSTYSLLAQNVIVAKVIVETNDMANSLSARTERLQEHIEQLVQGFSPAVRHRDLIHPMEMEITIELREHIGTTYMGDIVVNGYRPIYDSLDRSLIYRTVERGIEFSYDPAVNRVSRSSTIPDDMLGRLLYYNFYMALALYYDSFGDEGGEPFWQYVISNYSLLDTDRNPMSDDGASYLSASEVVPIMGESETALFREAWYIYHRGVLDQLSDDNNGAVERLMEVSQALVGLRRSMPNHPLLKLFIDIKTQEVNTIVQKAPSAVRAKVISQLSDLMPSIR